MTINRIAEMAHKYTDHDMIEAYTTLPPYPETRARLLNCFLSEERREDEQDLYALAVSLAQLGLDTHDMVDEAAEAEKLGQARSRQIKVLAGDYFNGRFYQILSQAGKVDIVQLVTSAICEVNRLKVNLYERYRSLKLSAEEYLEQSVSIKSGLFLAFTKLLSSRYIERFPELLKSLVRCEIISEELDRSGSGDIRRGFVFWYMLQHAAADDRDKIISGDTHGIHVMLHKYKIHGLLTEMLQTQVQQMKTYIEQFDSEALKAEIGRMLDPFALRLSMPKVAEEI